MLNKIEINRIIKLHEERYSYKEIAKKLHIAEKTVFTYVKIKKTEEKEIARIEEERIKKEKGLIIAEEQRQRQQEAEQKQQEEERIKNAPQEELWKAWLEHLQKTKYPDKELYQIEDIERSRQYQEQKDKEKEIRAKKHATAIAQHEKEIARTQQLFIK